MKPTKRKKEPMGQDADADIDDTRPVRFEALGELTSSEVIEQVKAGMSRISPDEDHNDDFGDIRENAA